MRLGGRKNSLKGRSLATPDIERCTFMSQSDIKIKFVLNDIKISPTFIDLDYFNLGHS